MEFNRKYPCDYYMDFTDFPGWCNLSDNPCLIDSGDDCESYQDYLDEVLQEDSELDSPNSHEQSIPLS